MSKDIENIKRMLLTKPYQVRSMKVLEKGERNDKDKVEISVLVGRCEEVDIELEEMKVNKAITNSFGDNTPYHISMWQNLLFYHVMEGNTIYER